MAQVFAIASTALNFAGQIAGADQANSVARYNAAAMRQQADATLTATNSREEGFRRRNAEGFSAQRTAQLQSGVDASTGTALIGAEQQFRDADLDALQLRYEGLMEARGLKAQAQMTRWEGKARKRQGYLSAVSSLMGSAGSYLSGGMGSSSTVGTMARGSSSTVGMSY